MTRNIYWGFIAIAPLVILVYIFGLIESSTSTLPFLIPAEYWQRNWYRDIVFFCVGAWLIFLIHSAFKRRFIWLAILLLMAFSAMPIYWWVNSAKNTYKNQNCRLRLGRYAPPLGEALGLLKSYGEIKSRATFEI